VCGGIRVRGWSAEYIAHGDRSATFAWGTCDSGLDRRGRAAMPVLDGLRLFVEVIRAPARGVVELAPLVERYVLVVVDIRRKAGGILAQHVEQLLPDRRRGGFKLRQPRKLAALVKLDRGQPGVVVLGGLLPVSAADAQRHVDERVEPVALRLRTTCSGIRDAIAHVLAELPGIRAVNDSPALDRLQRGRIESLIRGCVRECGAVGESGRHRPTLAFQHRRAHQQAREIAAIERQHLLDRVEGSIQVLSLATNRGEIEPRGNARSIEAHSLHQCTLGLHEVTGRHRPHSGLVPAGGVLSDSRLIDCPARLLHAVRLSPQRPPPQGFASLVTVGNNAARGAEHEKRANETA
jgi:hypothetical protein